MSSKTGPIYASVDLELTGFDPNTEEIIEIGIAVFEVVQKEIVFLERFQSLVRPEKTHVRNRITGLTGITQKDLDAAPVWSTIADKVRTLLDGVVLVGHGVDLDVRFLRAVGITSFIGIIDTLELSQIFLPTYHSYNLESLGYLFSVTHEGVHRAGGDAEATVGVLEGIMSIYRSLSSQTQTQLCAIAESAGKSWPELFRLVDATPQVPAIKNKTAYIPLRTQIGAVTQSHVLVTGVGEGGPAALQLASHIPPWSVAFLDREQAFAYAYNQPEVEPYVGAFEYLSVTQLDEVYAQYPSLTEKEQLGLMKVLVWRETYSTFGILSEINWSIVGTEVKKVFTQGFGGRVPEGLLAADFRSLPDVHEKRPLWVHRLEDLFDWLSQKSGYVVSWQGFVTGLKQVYNPEVGTGQVAAAAEVESLLARVDTYFASALLLVRSTIYRAAGSATQDELDGYVWQRLMQGAQSLITVIEASAVYDQSTFLQKQTIQLKRFFTDSSKKGLVSWIEYSDKNVSFINKPLQFREAHKLFIGRAHPVVYQTSIADNSALEFIRSRIGLENVAVQTSPVLATESSVAIRLHQGVQVHKSVSAFLQEVSSSTLVLFSDVEALRAYYDVSYPAIVGAVPVLAVGIHGGAHKIFRNFNRSLRSTVLAAVPALLAYVGEKPMFSKIIYVCPDVQAVISHPYAVAVAADMSVPVGDVEQIQAHIALARVLNAIAVKDIIEIQVVESSSGVATYGQTIVQFLQKQLSTVSSET